MKKKNLFIFFLVNSSKKHHIRLHSIQFKLNWKCKLSILRFLVVRFWIHFFSSWHRIYNSVMFTILMFGWGCVFKINFVLIIKWMNEKHTQVVCVCVCLKMIMMINNKKKVFWLLILACQRKKTGKEMDFSSEKKCEKNFFYCCGSTLFRICLLFSGNWTQERLFFFSCEKNECWIH